MRSSIVTLLVATLLIVLAATPAFAQTLDWSDPEAVVRAAVDAQPSLTGLAAQIRAAKERVAQAGIGSGDNGDARFLNRFAGVLLVTHRADGVGRRADEDFARVGDRLRELLALR